MKLLSKGFMIPSVNKDGSLLAGGNGSRIYIFDTRTNVLKYQLNKGYYTDFDERNRMLCVEVNGRFMLYDPEKGEILHQNKLPFHPEFTLPYQCWFDEDTLYFDYVERMPPSKCDGVAPIWHLVKYQISTQRFEELDWDGSIVGKWRDYFVMRTNLTADDDQPVNYALSFYKDGVLEKQVEIGRWNEAQINNGELYYLSEDKSVSIFKINDDFSSQQIYSGKKPNKDTFVSEYCVSSKYIALFFLFNNAIYVYDRESGRQILKENVQYKQNLTLIEDKLYVGTMTMLHVFNLNI